MFQLIRPSHLKRRAIRTSCGLNISLRVAKWPCGSIDGTHFAMLLSLVRGALTKLRQY